MTQSINTSQNLTLNTVPQEVTRLAEALARLHGPIVIRNESNGYHLYMPSPECLKTDGRKEIQSKHLTVNASKYATRKDWLDSNLKFKKPDPDFCAICHKTNTTYRVSDLLNQRLYPPLAERGIKNVASHVSNTAVDKARCLVSDGKGNMIPPDPGMVIPINELPKDHHAVQYLTNRGYDPDILYKQFKCSYCVSELPEDPGKGIFYKRLPLNFRDTSQGRIIFYSYINDVRVGWQARIIERTDGNIKSYWHPYNDMWVPMEGFNTDTNKWEVLPGVETTSPSGYTVLWKPSKYKTAFGMSRNDTLMGVDAAIYFNDIMKLPKSVVILVEGPLDAGRFGPMAVAMLGKYLSDEQANILVRKFKKLILVMDNDKAGNEARRRIKTVLSDKLVESIFVDVPSEFKDAGDMTTKQALQMIYPHIR